MSGRARFAQVALVACVVGSAVIHLLPLPGLLGADWLVRLYGIAPPEPAVEFLLRHRAWTFALLGVSLLVALRRRALLLPAIALVAASDIGFALLALDTAPLGAALARVVWFDLASLAMLAIATALARAQAREALKVGAR